MKKINKPYSKWYAIQHEDNPEWFYITPKKHFDIHGKIPDYHANLNIFLEEISTHLVTANIKETFLSTKVILEIYGFEILENPKRF